METAIKAKLELKHLAPYLPYRLEGKFQVSDVNKGAPLEIRNKELTTDCVQFFLNYCKPILRPLSDLTKEMKEKLKEKHPNCPNFFGMFEPKHIWEYHSKNLSNSFIEYCIMERLFEWHFDVFGLIEKGLAIDINTLK